MGAIWSLVPANIFPRCNTDGGEMSMEVRDEHYRESPGKAGGLSTPQLALITKILRTVKNIEIKVEETEEQSKNKTQTHIIGTGTFYAFFLDSTRYSDYKK